MSDLIYRQDAVDAIKKNTFRLTVAEARLYIIRDGLTDQLFFVKADSPKDAFMKFHKRMEDVLNAGRYVDGGEYDD